MMTRMTPLAWKATDDDMIAQALQALQDSEGEGDNAEESFEEDKVEEALAAVARTGGRGGPHVQDQCPKGKEKGRGKSSLHSMLRVCRGELARLESF